MSWDEMTPGESFCPWMERLQWNHSVLGWNESRGVILSCDGTTPGESFGPRIEQLQGILSVLGYNDSRGVFCAGME